MNNHTDLLNFLAAKYNLHTYLEIGVNVPNNNFDHIRCIRKDGVDPKVGADATHCMTSDEFFESHDRLFNRARSYDLIFIDGLHEWQQVKKDFDNSLRYLSEKGFIVLHDCNPVKEEYTHVPRDKRGVWNGDVYKFILSLFTYNNINYRTVDFDHGCTVVWKSQPNQEILEASSHEFLDKIPNDLGSITFDDLQNNQSFLKLISPQHFQNISIF